VRNGEIFLLNAHITPLKTASTHVKPEPTRTRKLLLNAAEIRKLIGKVERSGYTLVPIDLHFSKGRIKLEIGLAKGKRQFEKRDATREKDWKREQNRLMKQRSR
jgi:SsrA-binding protein